MTDNNNIYRCWCWLLQAFTEDVFIFILLVYIAH